ncbi:MAG: hypothetical protein AAF629_07100 [Chloroflexota bacterium]
MQSNCQPKNVSFIIVCAWCHRPQARPETSNTKPADVLAPVSFEISHTICPDCADTFLQRIEQPKQEQQAEPWLTNPPEATAAELGASII